MLNRAICTINSKISFFLQIQDRVDNIEDNYCNENKSNENSC